MASFENNIISQHLATCIVEASVPESYGQRENYIETYPPVSHEKQYEPFAGTIKKLESIVHMEKDKEIARLNGLLQQTVKQLEHHERIISNLHKYLAQSHGELGKIFGGLNSLIPFNKKETTLDVGPMKNYWVQKSLEQLLDTLAIQFSSNQENLHETMLLLETGSSMLKECQDQVYMENAKCKEYVERIGKSQEKFTPPNFSAILSPFSCPICQAQFNQQNQVMMHLRLIHNFELKNVPNKNLDGQKLVYRPQVGWDFKCTKCTAEFALREHLEIHDRDAHSMIDDNN